MFTTQITTITLFKFTSLSNKYWGLKMMQLASPYLKNTDGLSFYRLLGSGRGKGFNPLPDWSVYALLQVWESEKFANDFFNSSDLINNYKIRSSELFTLYMRNITSKGTWENRQPFRSETELTPHQPIAVITRANIKLSNLIRFWKHVPKSRQHLDKNKGLIYTKGFGEFPITQMATFSLWENYDSLKQFAYESKQHLEAIRKTRQYKWYSEELFARFHPYKSSGVWQGKNLIGS